MASPIADINRRRGGVTYMPPVRLPQTGPTLSPILSRPRQGGGGRTLADAASDDEAMRRYTMRAKERSGTAGVGGGPFGGGLGWVVGKVGKGVSTGLGIIDYPRAAVVGGLRQALDTEAAETFNRMLAGLPGVDYTPISNPDYEAGWQWSELWKDIKTHQGAGTSIVQPIMKDRPLWLRDIAGFGLDIAADPLTYLSAGVGHVGAAERAAGMAKLFEAQERTGLLVKTLKETGAADDAIKAAERYAERLGGEQAIERIGSRGLATANKAQLDEMGLRNAIRWGGQKGIEIPGSGAISRGVMEGVGAARPAFRALPGARAIRAARTPTGYLGLAHDLTPAFERLYSRGANKGGYTMERALRTLQLNEAMREAGGSWEGIANKIVDAFGRATSPEERRALVRAAETTGERNAATAVGEQMRQAAELVGAKIPELAGEKPYAMPHVLSREAFKFLNKIRLGENPLVDWFRGAAHITDKDLLEEGGFLQARKFVPGEYKIGKGPNVRTITIDVGDVDELNEKIGGLLQEAGFKGKVYETDPMEAWKRYINATKRDIGKQAASQKGRAAGWEGLETLTPKPPDYDPYGGRAPTALTDEEGNVIERVTANPQARPAEDRFWRYTDTAKGAKKATNARNKLLRGRSPKKNPQMRILQQLQLTGEAERIRLAEELDKVAEQAYGPIPVAKHEAEQTARAAAEHVVRTGQEVTSLQGQQRYLRQQLDEAAVEIQRLQVALQSVGPMNQATLTTQQRELARDLQDKLTQAIAHRENVQQKLATAEEATKLPQLDIRRRGKGILRARFARREQQLKTALDDATTELQRATEEAHWDYVKPNAAGQPSHVPVTKERYDAAADVLRDAERSGKARMYRHNRAQANRLLQRKTYLEGEESRVTLEINRHTQDVNARIDRMNETAQNDALAKLFELQRERSDIQRQIERVNADMAQIRTERNQSAILEASDTVEAWNRQNDWIANRRRVQAANSRLNKARREWDEWRRGKTTEAEYQAERAAAERGEPIDEISGVPVYDTSEAQLEELVRQGLAERTPPPPEPPPATPPEPGPPQPFGGSADAQIAAYEERLLQEEARQMFTPFRSFNETITPQNIADIEQFASQGRTPAYPHPPSSALPPPELPAAAVAIPEPSPLTPQQTPGPGYWPDAEGIVQRTQRLEQIAAERETIPPADEMEQQLARAREEARKAKEAESKVKRRRIKKGETKAEIDAEFEQAKRAAERTTAEAEARIPIAERAVEVSRESHAAWDKEERSIKRWLGKKERRVVRKRIEQAAAANEPPPPAAEAVREGESAAQRAGRVDALKKLRRDLDTARTLKEQSLAEARKKPPKARWTRTPGGWYRSEDGWLITKRPEGGWAIDAPGHYTPHGEYRTLDEAKRAAEFERLPEDYRQFRQGHADRISTYNDQIANMERQIAELEGVGRPLLPPRTVESKIKLPPPEPAPRHPFYPETEAITERIRQQGNYAKQQARNLQGELFKAGTAEGRATARVKEIPGQVKQMAEQSKAATERATGEIEAGIAGQQERFQKAQEAQRFVDQQTGQTQENYRRALDDREAARQTHEEIVQRTQGMQRPRKTQPYMETKKKGAPSGADLARVEAGTKPAYMAQPLHATLDDTRKIVAANPLGQDEAMNKIEAVLHSHEQALDALTREIDLPAREVDNIAREARNGKLAPVVESVLRSDWRQMWEHSDIVINRELERYYFNINQGLQSKLFGRTFSLLTNFFKTYATLSPGFHVRNALSAVFMNSSEGVKMATQYEAGRLWRQFAKSDAPVEFLMELRRTRPEVADAFMAAMASGAGGQFTEAGVSELRTGGQRWMEGLFRNKATKLSQKVGQNWVEGPVRLALAMDTTMAGGSARDALLRVSRIHFDYAQVSRFDERAKRIIPFWTFMSRNLPLQVTQMWTKPRLYNQYASFVRNFAGTAPEFTPQYIGEAGGFSLMGGKTPEGVPGTSAGMPIFLQPDLPHLRVQDDLLRLQNAASGQGLGQMLADVNPILTAPLEYALGQDFFTGKRYGPEDYSQAGPLGVPLAMLLAPLGAARQGADGNWYLSDKAMASIKSVTPPLERTSRLIPGLVSQGGTGSDRLLESWLRFSGIPLRTISEEQMTSEAKRRAYNLQDQARTLAATGG